MSTDEPKLPRVGSREIELDLMRAHLTAAAACLARYLDLPGAASAIHKDFWLTVADWMTPDEES